MNGMLYCIALYYPEGPGVLLEELVGVVVEVVPLEGEVLVNVDPTAHRREVEQLRPLEPYLLLYSYTAKMTLERCCL